MLLGVSQFVFLAVMGRPDAGGDVADLRLREERNIGRPADRSRLGPCLLHRFDERLAGLLGLGWIEFRRALIPRVKAIVVHDSAMKGGLADEVMLLRQGLDFGR